MVLFLVLLDSYMTTMLKLAFVSILVVMSDVDSQHVFKIWFTFWLHRRFKDDELILELVGLYREDCNWFLKIVLEIEHHFWN